MIEKIVERIIADLTDRRGLRQEWESLDADVQAEIIETWQDIVRQELAPTITTHIASIDATVDAMATGIGKQIEGGGDGPDWQR